MTAAAQTNMIFADPVQLTFSNNKFTTSGSNPSNSAVIQVAGNNTSNPLANGNVTFTDNTFIGFPDSANQSTLQLNLADVQGTVSGNTFDGVDIGILVANHAGELDITDNIFTNITRGTAEAANGNFGTGIALYNPTFDRGPITISGNTFSNSDTGIRTSTDGSGTFTLNDGQISLSDNDFAGNLYHIVDKFAGTITPAGDNSFDGVLLSDAQADATPDRLFDIADKIVDKIDVASYGLVDLKPGNIYVTANSFFGPGGTTAPSIQRGVDAAAVSETVHVDAGTYTSLVNVNKQVTLRGAQAGIDARNRTGQLESVLNNPGGSVTVNANDAVIDGFTITGASGPVLGVGMYLNPTNSGTQVLNNIYRDNIFGLYLNGAAGTNRTLVQHNWFDNNNRPGSSGGNGIYADQGSNKITVDENLFTAQSSASMVFAGTQSDLEITDNDINGGNSIVLFGTTGALVARNVINAPGGSGIFVSGSTSVEIAQNEVFGMSSGVSLSNAGGASSGVSIHNNKFHGNGLGVSIAAGGYTGELEVHENSIDGNTTAGIRNNSTATVDAINNWWGSSTGPSPVTINPLSDGTGDAITGTGAALVDFAPWLTNGTDADTDARGFQPTVGSVDNTPPAAPSTPVLTTDSGVTDDNTTNVNPPSFAGTAEANSVVRIYLDGATTPIDTTTADGDGDYSFELPAALTDGTHTVRVDSVDTAGNEGPSSGTLTFTIDATPPTIVITTVPGTPTDEGTEVDVTATITENGSGVDDISYTVTDSSNNIVATGTTATFSFTPDDNDTYTISYTVTDNAGNTTTTTASLVVNNVAPTVTGLTVTPNAIVEGASVTLGGTVNDPGDDLVTLTINWGDGSTPTIVNNVAPGTPLASLLLTHTYVDDNPTVTSSDPYTITVTATDGEATPNTSTAQVVVTVSNAAPAVELETLTATSEGNIATLNGTYTDDGTEDSHTLTVNWGDGNIETYTVMNGAFSTTHVYADDNATDSYTITATITDDDGGSDQATASVTVTNQNPVLTLNPVLGISENGTATLTGTYTDPGTPDTHSVTINWGDGSAPQTVAVTGGAFSITHTYVDDNPSVTSSDTYTIGVTLTDDDGGSDTESTTVTVSNVAPVLVLNPVTPISENGTATLTGTYSDAGPADTHTLSIDWQDGTGVQTVSVTGGSFSVTHQYLDDNATDTYVATATLTDDDGGIHTQAANIGVTNVAPVLTLNPVASVTEGGTATLSGTYSDVGSLDTHSIDINWGDGSTVQTVNVTGGAFSVTHTYVDDNPTGTPSDSYSIGVTLSDDDGGTDAESTPVTVNNSAPSVTISGPTTGSEGTGVTFNAATILDAGLNDTFTYTWTVTGPHGFSQSASGSGQPAPFSFTPPDDGAYQVKLAVTDDDTGTFTTPNATLNVGDVDPVIVVDSLDTTVLENGVATLQFHLSDPGNGDLAATNQVSINWGDGSAPTVINSGTNPTALATLRAGGSVTLTHTYADDATAGTSSDSYTLVFATSQSADAPEPARAYNPATVQGGPVSVTVNNVAPTGDFLLASPSSISAGDSVSVNWTSQSDAPADLAEGLRYSYGIDANNNGILESGERITPFITFGDGTYNGGTSSAAVTIPGSNFSTPGVYNIISEIRDNDGGVTTQSVTVTAGPVTFRVASITPNASGFDITFNRAFDQADINLYANDVVTPADVTVMLGSNKIRGSLVFTGPNTATFVRTYGPSNDVGALANGTYTVTVRSNATDGFNDGALNSASGQALDGNNDGVTGDDAVRTVVVNNTGRVVSLPDFTRGPNQNVEVPSASTTTTGPQNNPGLPVRINAGTNIRSLDFTLTYDETMLTIDPTNPIAFKADGVTLELPAGWGFDFNFIDLPGNMRQLTITASGSTELVTSGALTTVLELNAKVPAGAVRGLSEVLQLTDVTVGIPTGVTVNEVPALGDNAVHQVGYFGDTNNSNVGNIYAGADVTLMQRVVANLASGFAAYRNTDPLVIGDINGSGTFSGADTSLVQARVANQVVAQIPPITASSTDTLALTTANDSGVASDLVKQKDEPLIQTLFGDRPIL